VDWCYLGLIGAFRGILLLWDRRVLEKIEKFVGTNTVAFFFFLVSVIILSGFLLVFMVQMMIMIGNSYGMNWLN
jgi:hypothetical protein